MIARACYVMCDRCGSPADVVDDGAEAARVEAAKVGFKRANARIVAGSQKFEDVCSECWEEEDEQVGEEHEPMADGPEDPSILAVEARLLGESTPDPDTKEGGRK